MKKNEEYLVWQETQDLMKSNLINVDFSFLDSLTSKKHSLIEELSKYKFIAKMIPKDSNILEISCRNGFGSPILGEMAKDYTGFDNNLKCIENAKASHLKNNFKFVSKIENDKTHDAIVDLNSYRALDDKAIFNNHLTFDLLKKDGMFLCCIPNLLLNIKNDVTKSQNDLVDFFYKQFNYLLKFYAHKHLIFSGFSKKADFLLFICLEQKN